METEELIVILVLVGEKSRVKYQLTFLVLFSLCHHLLYCTVCGKTFITVLSVVK
jgi:hypothetical protein